MREWVGLLMYWAAGESSELFPGPQSAVCDRTVEACRRRAALLFRRIGRALPPGLVR
jgi:hypothetical protein